MRPEDELNFLTASWADEPVPAGLAERIIFQARREAQWQPWWAKLALTLGSWNRGWEVKGAALAAIAALGLLGGQLSSTGQSSDPRTTGALSWTEEL